MKLAHAIRLGGWLLVVLNLLMALGTIKIFMRMTPAIQGIIERNERSLHASEEMLAALALSGRAGSEERRADFEVALERARNNVTEPAESLVLTEIARVSAAAFSGNIAARRETVAALARFSKVNREAMIRVDRVAQQLGQTGAWGVVFMAICVFLAGVIYIRSMTRRVARPLEEIHAVIAANRRGETMRRCGGTDLPQEVKVIFTGINELLDQRQLPAAPPREFPEKRPGPGETSG